jgi:hypothetical protein
VHVFAGPAGLEAAAEYLGLTESELRDRLAGGQTLAEVAKAEGRSVDGLEQALVADAKERLDEAVENGRLTRAQADDLLEHYRDRIDDVVAGARVDRERGLFGPPGMDGEPRMRITPGVFESPPAGGDPA